MVARVNPVSHSVQISFEELLSYSPTGDEAPIGGSGLPVYRVELVREPLGGDAELHTIQGPEVAARIFERYLQRADREHFVAMFLDVKQRVIGISTVSVGILDQTLVHPREVFKPAILANAASVIVCHNHPSGDCSPSPEDRQVTLRLVEAAKILGIALLDHVIIGGNGTHSSFKQLGLI